MNLRGYSQQILLIDSDTNICFTIGQGRILLTEHYHLKECKEINELNDSLQVTLMKALINKDDQISVQDNTIELLEAQSEARLNMLQIKEKEIKKLKRRIFFGNIVTGFFVLTTAVLIVK